MCKMLKDMFTEKDNQTYDVIRVLGAISLMAFIGLAGLELTRHCHDFSLIEFSSGISMIMGVIAGGVTFKQKSET